MCDLIYCPCHITLSPLCYLKCPNQRSTIRSTKLWQTGNPSTQTWIFYSLCWIAPNHRPTVQTQRQACYPTPVPVIKGSPPSPTFPVNYHTTVRWKTAHLSSLSATSTWAFPKVFIAIWKAWGSGFWGWFPVGCKGIQMAAFKS